MDENSSFDGDPEDFDPLDEGETTYGEASGWVCVVSDVQSANEAQSLADCHIPDIVYWQTSWIDCGHRIYACAGVSGL